MSTICLLNDYSTIVPTGLPCHVWSFLFLWRIMPSSMCDIRYDTHNGTLSASTDIEFNTLRRISFIVHITVIRIISDQWLIRLIGYRIVNTLVMIELLVIRKINTFVNLYLLRVIADHVRFSYWRIRLIGSLVSTYIWPRLYT